MGIPAELQAFGALPSPFAVHHFQTDSDTEESEADPLEPEEIDPLNVGLIFIKEEPLDPESQGDEEPEEHGHGELNESSPTSPSSADNEYVGHEQAENLDLKPVLKFRKPKNPPCPRLRIPRCTFCSKPFTFSTRAQCSAHIKLHTGAKKLGCVEPGCGRIFTQKTALQRHQKTIHSESNPRNKRNLDNGPQCRICGKTLRSPEDCSVHVELHTGENKLGCLEPDCGMKFTRMSSLKRHVRIVHSEATTLTTHKYN